MIRTRLLLLCTTLMLFSLLIAPVEAQGGADGWTTNRLNLRAGPGTTYPVLTILPLDAGLVFEARSADFAWLLGHTEDSSIRGWVAGSYIRYREGFVPDPLPISVETITAAASPVEAQPAQNVSGGTAQVLMSVPVLPTISGRARDIFQSGSNDPHALIKVGDCNSEYWEFLGPLGSGGYNLGPYSALQPTVDFFQGSWGMTSTTAHGGFTILAVLDPTWANTGHCEPGETPLQCELRLRRPAVAVIMFGPNDVVHLTTAQYETALRQVVATTIQHGTIPVLTTFTWCRTDEFNEKGLQMNLITVNVAQENGIPLINFWRAAQSLPNCGQQDETHLSKPVMTTTGDFNGEEQNTGHTLRNLLTLQTLDSLRTAALQ